MKLWKLISSVAFLVLSVNANGAIISIDWQSTGDNLISRDTSSSLDWLDLTETNNMTMLQVKSQLGSGGAFEGWRYATGTEVISLWSNFNIDLSSNGPQSLVGVDANIILASNFLGNISCESNCSTYPYGTSGWIDEASPTTSYLYYTMGASIYQTSLSSYDRYGYSLSNEAFGSVSRGSYLVKPVPIPAALFLFSTGIIVLAATARRKTFN